MTDFVEGDSLFVDDERRGSFALARGISPEVQQANLANLLLNYDGRTVSTFPDFMDAVSRIGHFDSLKPNSNIPPRIYDLLIGASKDPMDIFELSLNSLERIRISEPADADTEVPTTRKAALRLAWGKKADDVASLRKQWNSAFNPIFKKHSDAVFGVDSANRESVEALDFGNRTGASYSALRQEVAPHAVELLPKVQIIVAGIQQGVTEAAGMPWQ